MAKRICTRVACLVVGLLIVGAAITATVLLVRRDATEEPAPGTSTQQDQSGADQPPPVGVTVASEDSGCGNGDAHVICSEHIAHAVPGREYLVHDLDGDGREIVKLDASRSHSHYFDPETNELGFIISWLWFNTTGHQIGKSSTPELKFRIGTAKIFLKVEDDKGNTHQDSTNVTVLPSTRKGAYCYYYEADGDTFAIEDNVVLGLKPFYGQEYPAIDFRSAADFPPQVNETSFQVRCTFYINTRGESAQFKVEHDGPIRMLVTRGETHPVIMESAETRLQNTSAKFKLIKGLEALQVWYLRLPGSSAHFRLAQTPLPTLHNLKSQLPVISELSPPNSTLEGGGIMKISGSGFWNDPQVYFGDGVATVQPDWERSSSEQLFITVPQAITAGDIGIGVGNKFGGSNSLPFRYSRDSLCPIKFEQTNLSQNGDIFKVAMITNIKYGPDHKLYMASLGNFVYSVSVARDLSVSNLCESESLGRGRAAIGLAFNPADSETILYVSSNIFFWRRTKRDDEFLWANGQVSVVKPGYNGKCLGVVGPVIKGLPVSNHDHGVNGLLFDDDGKLRIMVGGATNAGVPAITVGGIEESPLSGAHLIADVNRPRFDGNVVYDTADPGKARIVSGDVEVYQAGWRNSFELTLHSNGFIYATDNGANSEFGNRSTDCSSIGEPISPYHSDDKLAKVLKGKFGGHANRNRGRDNPIECVWRNPFDEPTNNYNPPIATLESSTDGIIEFTADIFGGQMKGDLLASKFSTNDENNNGRVYRIQLDEDGERKEDVDSLFEASGLSIAMTPWGDLLMPRLYEDTVMALKAVYRRDKEATLISVTPFRGPKGGGNEVLITGSGFSRGVVALFDGKRCTNVRERTDSSFKCTVPAGIAGKSVQVAIRLPNGKLKPSSGGYDYRYMRI